MAYVGGLNEPFTCVGDSLLFEYGIFTLEFNGLADPYGNPMGFLSTAPNTYLSQRNNEEGQSTSIIDSVIMSPSTWENITFINNQGATHPNWGLYSANWNTYISCD